MNRVHGKCVSETVVNVNVNVNVNVSVTANDDAIVNINVLRVLTLSRSCLVMIHQCGRLAPRICEIIASNIFHLTGHYFLTNTTVNKDSRYKKLVSVKSMSQCSY